MVDKKSIFKKLVEDQDIRPPNEFFEATVVSELKSRLAAEEDLTYVFCVSWTVFIGWKDHKYTIQWSKNGKIVPQQ